MNKNTLRLLLAGALMSPATLFALGLGEIRLNSALNQPFDADIEIASASPDELTSLKISLAGDDMFRRYGLDRPAFLSGFSFRLEGANSGHAVIKVRSANAVSEPFLNLLVEVSWTGGRLMREYTVLLDPPVYAPTSQQAEQGTLMPRGQAATVAPAAGAIERPAAAASAPAATTPSAPAHPTPAPAAAPRSTPRVSYAAGESYTVRPGDTLSKIANKLQVDSNAAPKQTMVALYRANPQAFANNNMNVLRSGAVLRVPAAAEIEAISATEASAEVARQYGAWRNSPGQASAPQGERLRLVPAQQPAAPAAAAPATNASKSSAAASETAARKAADEAEAKRLLDLKNAELARMQQQLNQSSAASKASAAVAAPAPPAAEQNSSVTAEAPAAAEPAPEQAAPAAKPVPVKPQPVTAEPGFFDNLANYWMWIVAAGLALIAGLLVYFRRRQQEAESESAIATMTARDFEDHLAPRGRIAARGFADQGDGDADTDEHEQPAFAPPPATARREPATPATARPSEDTLSSETAIHVDQQDALAEADFHMAYGLYDQAADIVKLAIERQPERRDLTLKLAEIYFVWGNKDLFLETARRLDDTRDQAPQGEWDKVAIMGKQICPDDPLFAGEAGRALAPDSVDLNLEGGEQHVDIDLYDAPEGDQPKSDVDFELATTGGHVAAQGDSGLDFLLDEPRRGVDDEPTREMDTNARTQETPTIESPHLADDLPASGSQTVREKFDVNSYAETQVGVDQTSEIALDEIDLNVDQLETTGTVEENAIDETTLGNDDLTQLAPRHGYGAQDRTVELPRGEQTKTMLAPHMDADLEGFDAAEEEKAGSTITVEQVDLDSFGEETAIASVDGSAIFKPTQKIDVDLDRFELNADDTVEQQRPSTTNTGIFRATQKLDVDLDQLADDGFLGSDAETAKHRGRPQTTVDRFSDEVFGGDEHTAVNTDLGSARDIDATAAFRRDETDAIAASLDLPELEPVTMSEVGTKLDLARAYMDMGDPDGARSILKEVLDEGNGGQKQEAQRLLDSIG